MPFVGCCALVYFWTLRFSRIGDFWTLRLGFFGNLDLRIINIANLKVAKARQEEALLTFRQTLLNAGTEVNDALLQWQVARRRLDLDRQQIISLQSAVRSSELLMRHSSQNYLEVLTARQTLLDAELSAVSDRFEEIQGVINLYHALGGGY